MVKYQEVLISRGPNGFDMWEARYDPNPSTEELWDCKNDLLQCIIKDLLGNAITDYYTDLEYYNLAKDGLPRKLENIKGNIYNEPHYLYGYILSGPDGIVEIGYFGINEVEV